MQRIGEYQGQLLNHFEAVYRPGDRQVARDLFDALGLHVEDYSFSAPDATQMMGIQFNPADRDPTNNIVFLHQMSPSQAAFDEKLRARLSEDDDLAEAQAAFLETIRRYPGGTPHFGIRYPSMATLDQVIERLEATSGELRPRLTVTEMPPYPARPGMPDIRQVFVVSDVFTTAPAGFGQTIELQADRSAA